MKKLRFIKKIIAAAFFHTLTIASATISAQQVSNSNTLSNNHIIDYNIEYFKVIEIGSNLYFKFLIKENKENTAYVLESSINENPFTACQIREGFKSPKNVPLLYCFSEKQNKNIATIYRIKRISFDGTIAYSEALTLDKNSPPGKWNLSRNNSFDKQNTFQNTGRIAPPNTTTPTISSAY